jgi:hypothetical protein
VNAQIGEEPSCREGVDRRAFASEQQAWAERMVLLMAIAARLSVRNVDEVAGKGSD